MFTHNGPAILAELNGEWLRVGTEELAAITQPTLLVGAADSLPELRDPNDVMAATLPNARATVVAAGT